MLLPGNEISNLWRVEKFLGLFIIVNINHYRKDKRGCDVYKAARIQDALSSELFSDALK